jgi:hypothetical protein
LEPQAKLQAAVVEQLKQLLAQVAQAVVELVETYLVMVKALQDCNTQAQAVVVASAAAD